MITALITPLALLGGLTLGSTVGTGPIAPSWTNERVLECDEGTVETYLPPAGFGAPFHIVGSTDVIVPKHVEVVLPGGEGPFVTIHVPGFDATKKGSMHCWYVDPIGLEVEFWGIRR
ncbi:MAG TPA: hypothetical protein VK045_07210 [Ornithinicoccus sp.]|nr:hypothetical protein [Ornithinicoccus sp.]